jgi:hypothetical protein
MVVLVQFLVGRWQMSRVADGYHHQAPAGSHLAATTNSRRTPLVSAARAPPPILLHLSELIRKDRDNTRARDGRAVTLDRVDGTCRA